MTSQEARVAAVVLNWNNYSHTATCLESLLDVEYPALDILVVDNGSIDGSAEKVESEYPGVTLIRTGENLGFAGGMNKGIEIALRQKSDYIWLLNNDLIIPHDGVLHSLVDKFEESTAIGAITPLIRSYPNTDDIWFWKGNVDWQSANGYHPTPPSKVNEGMIENDYIPFCCALFPASVFHDVGLLDESYFLYYEDVDFSTRLLDSGYDILTDTGTEIHHKRGGSSGSSLDEVSSYYFARNQLLFREKFKSRVNSSFFVWYFKDIVWGTIKRLYNTKLSGLRALYKGVFDGLRKRNGRGPYP